MFSSSTFRPDSQPLTHFRGYPVYLATVLVAVHILAMLAVVVSPVSLPKGMVFAPGVVDPLGGPIAGEWYDVWRWFTYPFFHLPNLWFVVEMFFLFRFGSEIEKVFGRWTLAKLYAGLVLLPVALVTAAHLLGRPGFMLAGTDLSHFCLFLGICLLYPGAVIFCSIPWLTLKIVGPVMLAIFVLMDLASRDFAHLGLLLANVALTYGVLRHAGLTPRFAEVGEAFRKAMPSPPKFRTVPAASASKPSAKYEAKIRPRPELAPEKKAVEEVDALLDKIARGGMASLTPAEREKLQRASERLQKPD